MDDESEYIVCYTVAKTIRAGMVVAESYDEFSLSPADPGNRQEHHIGVAVRDIAEGETIYYDYTQQIPWIDKNYEPAIMLRGSVGVTHYIAREPKPLGVIPMPADFELSSLPDIVYGPEINIDFGRGDVTITHSLAGEILTFPPGVDIAYANATKEMTYSAIEGGFIRADGMICTYNQTAGQMEPTGRKWCLDEPEADAPTFVKGETQ